MRTVLHVTVVFLVIALSLALPAGAQAQCPGNLLTNPSFEGAMYQGEIYGTSLSSWLSVDWYPWAILGDQQINREIEFFLADAQILQEGGYRVHSGRYAQKFFSGYSTHHAGFYQRVNVRSGSRVTFSMWVQIATGQSELWSGGLPISDLEQAGNYRAYVGIDPFGNVPSGFGASPSGSTVWSAPVLDRQTRTLDAQGREIDAWVQISVSTIAQSNVVTVFTRGQPEFPVKNNSSFWDDGCLFVSVPPTPTLPPSPVPSPTPLATDTPLPSPTPPATSTSVPTDTPLPTAIPTDTPLPTDTPPATPAPSDTPAPTATATATAPPITVITSPSPLISESPTATPVPEPGSSSTTGGMPGGILLVAAGLGVVAVAFAAWQLWRKR